MRTPAAQIVRSRTTSHAEIAIASATRRSLWPLAALWKSTTGFRPNAATAKAAREGRTRRATAAITNVVARLAAIAISRNVSTSTSKRLEVRVTSPDRCEKSGPYTDGVSTHLGPTSSRVRRLGKSAGVCTYGFA